MTLPQMTTMASEIAENPDMLARQFAGAETNLEAGRQLRRDGIRGLVTCARGTSDHAATFFK
jgi:glucosamine--fructose-6-phosphate aminotransferase (isomerizing)